MKQSNFIVIQTGTDAQGQPAQRRTRIKGAPSKEGATYKAGTKKRRQFTPAAAEAWPQEQAPTLEQWLQYQSLINLASLARATWPDKSGATAKARLHNHLTGEKPLSKLMWNEVLQTLEKFTAELQTKIRVAQS